MPATSAEPAIRYSRPQRLQGQIARAKADIASHKESIRFSRAGLRYRRLDDTSEGEMLAALAAMKRHPCSIWCAGYNERPRLLGFCVEAPHIDIDEAIEPVVCDVEGKKPFDKIVAGESGRISGDLVFFSWPIFQSIQNRASGIAATAPGAASAPGQLGVGQLDTLIQSEGGGFTCWVLLHRAGTPIFQERPSAPSEPFPSSFWHG